VERGRDKVALPRLPKEDEAAPFVAGAIDDSVSWQ
jgi:hypothetical protein